MEFILTEHKFRILTGSKDGTTKGRKMSLICSTCDKLLIPTGYAICKTLGCKTQFNLDQMTDKGLNKSITCSRCGNTMVFSPKEIVWTTVLVSRHRKKKHKYYEKSCFEKKFVGKDDD